MGRLRKIQILTVSIAMMCIGLTGCGNKAASYYEAGVSAYNEADYETAREELEQAIELKDDNADYYIQYGFTLIQLGEYDAAQDAFDQAILDKENSIVKKNNKKAYRGKGICYYTQGNYEEALECFETAESYQTLKDLNVDILSYMGTTNRCLGNYTDAISNFTEALESDSKNALVLQNRAECYYLTGDYEKSLTDYEAALAIESKEYDLYFGKYQVLLALGQDEEAAKVLETVQGLESEDTDVFDVARLNYYLGNTTKAQQGFESAVENGTIEAYLYLGDMQLEAGATEAALSYYESYEANSSLVDASFYKKIGECYLETREYEKALTSIQTGLSIAGSSQKQALMKDEIIAYERTGDYATALTKAQEYVEAYPDDEDAALELEFLKTRQGTSEAE